MNPPSNIGDLVLFPGDPRIPTFHLGIILEITYDPSWNSTLYLILKPNGQQIFYPEYKLKFL